MSHKNELLKIHNLFLGYDPTPLQSRFYDAFPRVRGLSSHEKIRKHIEAVAVLGISQTWKKTGDEAPHQVFFFVPTSAEMAWCLDVLKEMAMAVFKLIKGQSTERDAKMKGARMIGDLFNHLHIGVLTDASSPPERWVAFGYKNTDALAPEWLRKSLLIP